MASSAPTPPPSPDLQLDDLMSFLQLPPTVAPAKRADSDEAANLEQKWKLLGKRFEYAWNFFEFHARQRTTMFNFFLVFVGFIFTGYASLLKDAPCLLSMVVALTGAALTIVFIFLDRRNEELVHVAEATLLSLEKDVLFAGYVREVSWPMRRAWHGGMKGAATRRQLGILLRQESDENSIGKSKYEHGRWIPTFQCVMFLLFLLLAVFSYCQWKSADFHSTFRMGLRPF
jgi:hypothetical protein